MKRKLPLGVRLLLGFLSFLLCICLFVTTLAAIAIVDVQVLTSKDGLQNLISQVLFSPVSVHPLSVRGEASGGLNAAVRGPGARLDSVSSMGDLQLPDGMDLTGILGDQEKLLQTIYDMAEQQYGELPVTYEQAEEFFERSTLPDFLSEKAAAIINDCYTGDYTTTITLDEIRQQINANRMLIEECFDYTITDEDVNTALDMIEESEVLEYVAPEKLQSYLGDATGSDSFAGGQASASQILSGIAQGNTEVLTLPAIMTLVRTVTSTTALISVIAVCVILMALLALINMKQIHLALIDSGITVGLAGLLMLLPTILPGMLPMLFVGAVGELLRQLLAVTCTVSGVAAGIGLVLLILGIVVFALTHKKEQPLIPPAAAEA